MEPSFLGVWGGGRIDIHVCTMYTAEISCRETDRSVDPIYNAYGPGTVTNKLNTCLVIVHCTTAVTVSWSFYHGQCLQDCKMFGLNIQIFISIVQQ